MRMHHLLHPLFHLRGAHLPHAWRRPRDVRMDSNEAVAVSVELILHRLQDLTPSRATALSTSGRYTYSSPGFRQRWSRWCVPRPCWDFSASMMCELPISTQRDRPCRPGRSCERFRSPKTFLSYSMAGLRLDDQVGSDGVVVLGMYETLLMIFPPWNVG